MKPPKRYLITSALPYANGPLHIGHLAGAYLSADAYVRYLRLMGEDVVYVCGSDEHGAAITIKSLKEGVSPKEIVDKYHELLETALQDIGISFDFYHRTSEELHHKTSQDFFRKLYTGKRFIKKESEQYYDEESEQFLADRYITGTCPRCGYDGAYGDQCENCGAALSPEDLIEPKSTISGSIPILKTTAHWYLPLDEQESWLTEWITEGKLDGKKLHDPALWKNHVLGQCKSWLDGGLQPRAITRDLNWGVDVPQEIEGSEGKKLYVWMDAPIGYISSTKAWAKESGEEWQKYWQDPDTALIHFIGKDNIVFHCLIFPVLLKLHGDYILPRNVPANQFVNLEGQKVSTSRGWAVWVHEYLEEIPNREDELRYYLFKIMPEQKDSEFTWKGYQEANNNELVNNFGNFVNRVVVLIHKYFEGKVPAFEESIAIDGREEAGMPSWHDVEMLHLFDQLHELTSAIRLFDFRGALHKFMEISTGGNQLLQNNEPWKRIEEDVEQVKAVINLCLQYTVALSVAMYPFLPFSSAKLRQLLNLAEVKGEGELIGMLDKLAEGTSLVDPDHEVSDPVHLFTRIPDEVVEEQIEKLRSGEKATSGEEISTYKSEKKSISFQEFDQLDLRTGIITGAEKVNNTDKLLKLEIDLGYEKRSVCSGIAEYYTPDEVIGHEVVVVANLEPKKIRGVLSKGMILMAEDPSGKLTFVRPDKNWPQGMVVS